MLRCRMGRASDIMLWFPGPSYKSSSAQGRFEGKLPLHGTSTIFIGLLCLEVFLNSGSAPESCLYMHFGKQTWELKGVPENSTEIHKAGSMLVFSYKPFEPREREPSLPNKPS